MLRVNIMDEKLNLEGFDSVWQRVTERSDKPESAAQEQNGTHENAVCLVKQPDSSCAVRFIPKF